MPDLRMPDLNRVTIVGNLTRDPELKFIPSGTALCKLGLACNRRYKTKDGEQKEETLFINITVWGKSAEYVGENLKKGQAILVEGRLKSDEWEDKETGAKRSQIEVSADRIQAISWTDKDGQQAPPDTLRPSGKETPPF